MRKKVSFKRLKSNRYKINSLVSVAKILSTSNINIIPKYTFHAINT